MKKKAALLIIDLQNDFCPGGSLAVPEGDLVVPVMNRYIELFHSHKLPILASRDWHPPVTSHFQAHGGLWPAHCVQGSIGARFHSELHLPQDALILSKGMDPNRDDYSALTAQTSDGISLDELLQERGIQHLFIGGLATDYCVKETVLDSLTAGYEVTLLSDAVRGVNLQPDDSSQAIAAMIEAGAKLSRMEEILDSL